MSIKAYRFFQRKKQLDFYQVLQYTMINTKVYNVRIIILIEKE